MARKSKIEPRKEADSPGVKPAVDIVEGDISLPSKARGEMQKPPKKKTASKKKGAGKAKKAPPTLSPADPTDDEIRLRAYFIAQRRIQLSLPGDSAHDWIEARRQLVEEAGGATS